MNSLLAKKPAVKVGDVFGRLTVLGSPFYIRHTGARYGHVVCQCECGTYGVFLISNLRRGHSSSCGCFRSELSVKHGFSRTGQVHPLLAVRNNMIRRCHKPENVGYRNYGGRGISVCDEWRKSFEAFARWAIASGWQRGLEIDRIDNDGNYEPGNCRFVTRRDNSRNKKQTVFITAFGETKCAKDWAVDPRCRTSYGAVLARVKRGWPPEAVITTPSMN